MELEKIKQMFEEFFNENNESSGLVLLSDNENKGYKLLCGKRKNIIKLLYNVFMSDPNDELIELLDEAARKYMEKKQVEADRNNLAFFISAKNKYKS